MMRSTLILTLFATGCSQAASVGPPPVSSTPTVLTSSATIIDMADDSRGAVARIPISVDSAWAALPSIYYQLGIELGTMMSTTRQIGNLDFMANGRLGDVRLDEYFRCGLTAAGASVANSYRLNISVLTSVEPVTETETEVRTILQATASSNSGVSSNPRPCASTGELEKRIVEALL